MIISIKIVVLTVLVTAMTVLVTAMSEGNAHPGTKAGAQSGPKYEGRHASIRSTTKETRPFYAFDYGVINQYAGTDFGQEESSNGDNVKGSYTVQLPDGRKQTVNYVADHHNGYQAEVSYYGEAQYPHDRAYPTTLKPKYLAALAHRPNTSNPLPNHKPITTNKPVSSHKPFSIKSFPSYKPFTLKSPPDYKPSSLEAQFPAYKAFTFFTSVPGHRAVSYYKPSGSPNPPVNYGVTVTNNPTFHTRAPVYKLSPLHKQHTTYKPPTDRPFTYYNAQPSDISGLNYASAHGYKAAATNTPPVSHKPKTLYNQALTYESTAYYAPSYPYGITYLQNNSPFIQEQEGPNAPEQSDEELEKPTTQKQSFNESLHLITSGDKLETVDIPQLEESNPPDFGHLNTQVLEDEEPSTQEQVVNKLQQPITIEQTFEELDGLNNTDIPIYKFKQTNHPQKLVNNFQQEITNEQIVEEIEKINAHQFEPFNTSEQLFKGLEQANVTAEIAELQQPNASEFQQYNATEQNLEEHEQLITQFEHEQLNTSDS